MTKDITKIEDLTIKGMKEHIASLHIKLNSLASALGYKEIELLKGKYTWKKKGKNDS